MANTTLSEPRAATSGDTLRFLRRNMREYGILVAFVVIFTFFAVATGGNLVTPFNMTKIIEQQSFIIVMAVGMLMVIVCGHIDLSVGSVLGFIGALAAYLIGVLNLDPTLTIAICLVAGTLIGAMQGFWIAYFKIPSFIVTLAGMLIFKGLTLAVLSDGPISLPPAFKEISTSFIPDIPGGYGMSLLGPEGLGLHSFRRFNLLALLVGLGLAALVTVIALRGRAQRVARGADDEPLAIFVVKTALVAFAIAAFSYLLAGWRGLPNVLIIMAVVVAFYNFMTRKMTIGRRIYAIGGNEKAAKLSGVNSEWLTFLVFANMGFLTALAGLIFAARLGVAQQASGLAMELDVIAAVFIGGASMSGGVGTIVGAVIGALIMGVMNSGMFMLGLPIELQQVIKGVLLLAAVIFDVLNKKKAT